MKHRPTKFILKDNKGVKKKKIYQAYLLTCEQCKHRDKKKKCTGKPKPGSLFFWIQENKLHRLYEYVFSKSISLIHYSQNAKHVIERTAKLA